MKRILFACAAGLLCITLCLALTSCAKKTIDDNNGVIATVGGRDIETDEFIYYLLPYKDYYLQNDPNFFKDDATRTGALFDSLIMSLSYDNALYTWAEENGVTLTESDYEHIEDDIKQDTALYGGEAEFKAKLAENNQTERLYRELLGNKLLLSKISELVYAEDSPVAVSDEEVQRYITENEVLGAKHILILSADDPEASLARAEDVLAQLHSGADFDALMNELSEDTGLASNPDGYTFLPAEMVEEFTKGTQALEIGEMSGIVESSFGYHIILRIEPDAKHIKEAVITGKLQDIVEKYAAKQETVYCADYDGITIDDIEFKGVS